jgi:hypothetical protein
MYCTRFPRPFNTSRRASLVGVLRERAQHYAVLQIGSGQRAVRVASKDLATFKAFRTLVEEAHGLVVEHECETEPTPLLRRLAWRASIRGALLRGSTAA